MGLTPDQVLDYQDKFNTILKNNFHEVEHRGNDHVVDDYIFTFMIRPGDYERLRKAIDEIKKWLDVDTCVQFDANKDLILDITLCYPDD